VGWNGYAKLWSQIARDTMRQGATLLGGAEIDITPAADTGAWRVVVDVDAPQGFANDLVGEIEILDPALAEEDAGRVRTEVLSLTAPGRYEAEIRDVTSGQRVIKAKLYDDGQDPKRLTAEAVSSVSVPYPAELSPDQLAARPELLAELTDEGTDTGSVSAVLQDAGEARGRTRVEPLWPLVLWGLLLPLVGLDILLRRVSFGFAKSRA
jgi:hypothetical protein